MDEKSNEILAALAAAMEQSTSEMRRAGAMVSEQMEAGNLLDGDLTTNTIQHIHQMVEAVGLIEAMRLKQSKSDIAEKWGMSALVYEVQVAVMVGALVMLYIENTQLTPDEFIARVLPKLTEQLRTMYAVNYAEWQHKQQMHPSKDDDQC
jgi:ABC-type enterobactin transport system permease subunit